MELESNWAEIATQYAPLPEGYRWEELYNGLEWLLGVKRKGRWFWHTVFCLSTLEFIGPMADEEDSAAVRQTAADIILHIERYRIAPGFKELAERTYADTTSACKQARQEAQERRAADELRSVLTTVGLDEEKARRVAPKIDDWVRMRIREEKARR